MTQEWYQTFASEERNGMTRDMLGSSSLVGCASSSHRTAITSHRSRSTSSTASSIRSSRANFRALLASIRAPIKTATPPTKAPRSAEMAESQASARAVDNCTH